MECAFQSLLKIPNQVGYMVISDRTILGSHGELANSEETAHVVLQILHACRLFRTANPEPFNSVTVQFSKYFYVITRNGNRIYIVKRKVASNEQELNS